MALDIICPHYKKKVIESYRIINPYLYGSKIQICKTCGVLRMYKHIDYYKDNPQIKNTFDFLKIVIDNWIIKG